MAGESTEQLLRLLTGQTGDSAPEIYAKYAGFSLSSATNDTSLEQLVRRKLVAGGKSAQLRESLLSTLLAGGAIGESVEGCLLKTGLLGFT